MKASNNMSDKDPRVTIIGVPEGQSVEDAMKGAFADSPDMLEAISQMFDGTGQSSISLDEFEAMCDELKASAEAIVRKVIGEDADDQTVAERAIPMFGAVTTQIIFTAMGDTVGALREAANFHQSMIGALLDAEVGSQLEGEGDEA